MEFRINSNKKTCLIKLKGGVLCGVGAKEIHAPNKVATSSWAHNNHSNPLTTTNLLQLILCLCVLLVTEYLFLSLLVFFVCSCLISLNTSVFFSFQCYVTFVSMFFWLCHFCSSTFFNWIKTFSFSVSLFWLFLNQYFLIFSIFSFILCLSFVSPLIVKLAI